MKSIIEASVMTNFNLSESQKQVLIRTYNAPSPEAAYPDTATNEKEVAARLTLVHAGMLKMTDTTVELTADGKQLMADEGLVDEAGNLTQAAHELAGTMGNVNEQKNESFDLLAEVNNNIKNQECGD